MKCGVGMECMQYTIRGIPGYLDSGIRLYAEKESKSLNQALLDMLAAELGFFGKHKKNESLMELAGSWQEDPAADKALAEMRMVDEDL